jgi:hypothetical protein
MVRSRRDERPQQPIRQREHDVQVFEGVIVMDAMVRIQPPKNPGLFNPTALGNVHTPVEGLIKRVVGHLCD